jgi:aryl-alcohol dehydrogenase-like predicted oxidoreductase
LARRAPPSFRWHSAAWAYPGTATIHAALDHGVTLLDTGDYYGAGDNELLIGRALQDRRDKALLSVKFGALRGPDGSWLGMDARPTAV